MYNPHRHLQQPRRSFINNHMWAIRFNFLIFSETKKELSRSWINRAVSQAVIMRLEKRIHCFNKDVKNAHCSFKWNYTDDLKLFPFSQSVSQNKTPFNDTVFSLPLLRSMLSKIKCKFSSAVVFRRDDYNIEIQIVMVIKYLL